MTPTIALVGVGDWGANILRDLRALGADVVAVAPSEASRGRARDGGATAIVGTVEELGAVDGAVVATPAQTHAEVCHALLARGVPTFCEKPLTVDLEQARELARVADDRLFVMDKWRYHPGVEALRDIVRSGELGAPVGLTLVREQWGAPDRDSDTVWVHVPHDLSIAFEVFGGLGPARHARAEVVDGIVTGLHGTLGDDPWIAIGHSKAAPVSRRSTRLVCEGGTATLADGYDDAILVGRGAPRRGSPPERRAIDTEWPLPRELRAFLAHLRGGPPPRSSAAEHLVLLERLVDLRRAAGIPD